MGRLITPQLFLALVAGAGLAGAQDTEDCLGCHDVEDLTVVHQGRQISLYVDPERYEDSVHGAVDCVFCHTDLMDVEDYPHERDLARVDCTECHDDDDGPIAGYRRSTHGRLAEEGAPSAPLCQDCHGGHYVTPLAGLSRAVQAEDRGSGLPPLDREALLRREADAPVAAGRLNAMCGRCHGDIASTGPEDIHARALAGRTCLACHDAHAAAGPTPLVADQNCLECHADVEELPAGAVPPVLSASSVHGAAGVQCVLCHVGLRETAGYPHGPATSVSCTSCHAAATAAWERGVHHNVPNGHPAAECTDCHGTHDILPVSHPRSKVFPLNLADTCEACHRPDPPPEHPAPAGEEVARYETSVHGRALRESGLVVTATCSSCHGSHEIHPVEDPDAPTSRLRVPFTCGVCHVGILNSYLSGVHGEDFLEGVTDVPVCTDCHGEHTIEDPALGGSSVSAGLVAETCARCHANGQLADLYELRGTSLASWGRSYHGIATALGERKAANCASCHGFHDIYPSSDPRSKIHPDRLAETCESCHPGAGATFAKVPVHSVLERESNFIAWIIRTTYLYLIAAVIGAFLLFIAIDLFGLVRLRLGWGPPEPEPVDRASNPDENELFPPHETLERLTPAGRVQHGILVLSFLLLVVTGLPLFLHDLPVFQKVLDFEGGFHLRSQLHRAGAFGLIGLSFWHLVWLLAHPGGRRWFRSMMFRPRDVRDFLQDAMFSLGLLDWLARRRAFKRLFERHPQWRCRTRPQIGSYGLVEKLEYGAVLWGNVVMILTGVLLWRPNWFLGPLPTWVFDVCRVVHGYEATLAFLAIIIWHMYHVHLRPDVFPMSRVWLTGRVSRSQLRHHHTRQYLRILEQRRAARALTPPAAPSVPREQERVEVR